MSNDAFGRRNVLEATHGKTRGRDLCGDENERQDVAKADVLRSKRRDRQADDRRSKQTELE